MMFAFFLPIIWFYVIGRWHFSPHPPQPKNPRRLSYIKRIIRRKANITPALLPNLPHHPRFFFAGLRFAKMQNSASKKRSAQ